MSLGAMVLAQTCEIGFPAARGRKAHTLRRVLSVNIERSVRQVAAVAKVELPRKLYYAHGINDLVKTDDPIVIRLGYNGQLNQEFAGYVSSTTPNGNVQINCMDEAWRLRKQPVHKILKAATLANLLAAIAPNHTVDAANMQLGDVKMARTNAAAVLEVLKEQFAIYSFFDGKTLVSGKQYGYHNKTAKFALGTFDLPINLEYKDTADIKVKVLAQSVKSDGTKLQVEVGDQDGTTSKLIYTNINTEADLTKLATADYKRLKRSGYRGTFDWLGWPNVLPGMALELSDLYYPERAGKYYIEGTTVNYSEQGYYRTIKISAQ